MTFRLIRDELADQPVAVCCRVLGVSSSGYHAWRRRPPSPRALADERLLVDIRASHAASRGTYGARRVHADLRLGLGQRVGRKRVERLMRLHGLSGVTRRRRRGCTVRDPGAAASDDLVNRRFHPDGRDLLWVADITEHPTDEGKVYVAFVVDAWSRRCIGLTIADHLRAELVVDALQQATWRRRPPAGRTVHHSDHGTQYTSWAFGQRLRHAGLLASMGSIGDCFDNAMAESFVATLQTELLDRRRWRSRAELANSIFEFVEVFYNRRRRHSSLDYLSPNDYELRHADTPVGEAA